MTSSTLPIPITASADVQDVERASKAADPAEAVSVEACDACPHPRPDHDAIATRFCSATRDGAATRGCACQA